MFCLSCTNGWVNGLWSPSFRRRCFTANRLLRTCNANTKLFGFLRRHYRLCLAKHLGFLGSHMCLDELLQFLELRYPLVVVSRTDFKELA